jgi:hypothetical protein
VFIFGKYDRPVCETNAETEYEPRPNHLRRYA